MAGGAEPVDAENYLVADGDSRVYRLDESGMAGLVVNASYPFTWCLAQSDTSDLWPQANAGR